MRRDCLVDRSERHRCVWRQHNINTAPRLVVDDLPRVPAAAGVFRQEYVSGRQLEMRGPSRVSKSKVPLKVMTSCRTGAVCHASVPPGLVSRNDAVVDQRFVAEKVAARARGRGR